MKDVNLFRRKKISELNNDLFLLKQKYFNLRMKLSLNQFKQNHIIRKYKRSISLLKTVIYEKKMQKKKDKNE